jgi:2-polyprenyl-3-methyl-5-hydroxy-6-metoxy-1,4-benzoquinol methylase
MTQPSQPDHCPVCGATGADVVKERASVRSNVRVFSAERFEVWRCGACGSLHATEEVDLAHYYARYPFHAMPVDWRTRVMYDNQLARLRKAGLHPGHRILDYGCGGGNFVKHLKRRGYTNAQGFDEYSSEFGDRSVLDQKYDCVFSQDVVEHVAEPHALLDRFHELAEPGGLIAVGTPNATALDLSDAERYVHALHLPYHRHILSKSQILSLGDRRGWKLSSYYPTQYGNTPVPFLNSSFYLYYLRVFDNCLDVLMESVKPWPLILRWPMTLFWGLFGYFFAKETDVMAIYRRGRS